MDSSEVGDTVIRFFRANHVFRKRCNPLRAMPLMIPTYAYSDVDVIEDDGVLKPPTPLSNSNPPPTAHQLYN